MTSFIEWIDELPTERIKARVFFALPEYSATIPTGVTIGKRWRCLVGAHDPYFRGKPRWVIREFVAVENPKMAGIAQYRPIIIAERPR